MVEIKTDIITSKRNKRIVAARKLDQRKHRQHQNRFLVEGLQLLHMALDAGVQPVEVFYCRDLFIGSEADYLISRFAETDADLVPVSEYVLEALSEREASQGIVATFALFEHTLFDLVLDDAPLIVILDRLQDPGNVGTLIRTADAAGAQAVILLEPCVDPFDPKTVRGSMWSLFNVPLVRSSTPDEVFGELAQKHIRIVAADAHQGELWGHQALQGAIALILGNEARGLSPDVAPHVNTWVRLPVAGQAESLNVAVAGGILIYTWLEHHQ